MRVEPGLQHGVNLRLFCLGVARDERAPLETDAEAHHLEGGAQLFRRRCLRDPLDVVLTDWIHDLNYSALKGERRSRPRPFSGGRAVPTSGQRALNVREA